MVIDAAEPLLANGRAELTIVGDGPQRPLLEQLAARSGNPAAIRFTGAIPHAEVQQYFAASDLFVFPSIREFGGAVVLEAMAMGAVPIVVNYGGPSELVTDATGFRVEIGPRAQIVQAIRDVIEAVAAHPSSLLPKIATGRRWVDSHFTWDAKARQVVDIYHKLLDHRFNSRDIPRPNTNRSCDAEIAAGSHSTAADASVHR